MIYRISEDAVRQASKCRHSYQCLDDGKYCMCSIDRLLGDSLMISIRDANSCNYFMSYGYSGFCHCPVRREIYQRYKT